MTVVTMPQLGESVTEGTILKWMKQPGDPVELDDSLCEIETEKVTAELPSPFSGTMGKILVPEGETVEVGADLCEIDEGEVPAGTGSGAAKGDARWAGGPMAIPPDEGPGATPPPVAGNGGVAQREATEREPVAATARAARSERPDGRERFYSPVVMRLAQEHNLDLATIQGSGIGGRVTRKDVEALVASARRDGEGPVGAPTPAAAEPTGAAPRPQPADGAPYEVITLSPTRRTIAENLRRSNVEAPQAWTMVEADVTPLVALRNREKDRFQREEGIDLTLLPYFTAAVCEALREYPMLNARWEGDELRRYRDLNLSIAVATETGLVTPVVHSAGDLSVTGLAKRIADLAQRAHARKLKLEDIEGGTFTVNNTGSFGSIASKPIVNYPQVAIVTMERVVKRPVMREDDAIAVRSMVNLCLSFDHRAMDGFEAGGFLAALKKHLEAIG
jgi:2-oxoisovalerate dehydrogenase E2 component (dihydrolipoyl transacylase)